MRVGGDEEFTDIRSSDMSEDSSKEKQPQGKHERKRLLKTHTFKVPVGRQSGTFRRKNKKAFGKRWLLMRYVQH